MAETLSDPDSALEAPDFAALPGDVLRLLFKHLGLKDLLNAASTCLSWNRCSSGIWRSRCLARWQHWRTAPPAAGAADKDWRDTYVQRHKVDAHILQLLTTDACWPAKKSGAYRSILDHGADALDVLAAAARSKALSGLYVGTAYRAHTALLRLRAQIAGERLQQLLSAGSAGTTATPTDNAGVSLEAVSTADAAGTAAGEQQLNPGVSRQEGPQDPVLEVALQLAQALHPLADMSAVRDIIQQLGDELIRRLDSAGAAPDSMQALELLNALLFSPQAVTTNPQVAATRPRTHSGKAPFFAAYEEVAKYRNPDLALVDDYIERDEVANADESDDIPTAGDASCSSGPSWLAVWGRDEELFGPDLSTFEVPCDGHSCVGLEGNASPGVYRRVDSSCIDSVLAQRGGLPITMAILHRAVGRRAGLDIELVNMPGNVINRVQVAPGSGGGSSSSGTGTMVQSVYVDVFYGKVLDEAGLRALWDACVPHLLRRPLPSEAERPSQLPSMTAATVCKRMLFTLWKLHGSDSTSGLMEPGSRLLPRRLEPCLLQLGPKFARGEGMNILVATAAAYSAVEECLAQDPDLLGNQDNQNKTNVRSRQPGVVHSVGTRVYFQQEECSQRTGFVCGWSVPGQEELLYDVLSAPVKQCAQVKLKPGQLQAALDPSPAGSMPPWGSSSCVELVEEACGLLQGGWFDPDFEECIERFSSSRGQQLVSPGSLGDVCVDLRSCSTSIGRYFDAGWFDAAQEQWCLVPNAYMRHRFPEG